MLVPGIFALTFGFNFMTLDMDSPFEVRVVVVSSAVVVVGMSRLESPEETAATSAFYRINNQTYPELISLASFDWYLKVSSFFYFSNKATRPHPEKVLQFHKSVLRYTFTKYFLVGLLSTTNMRKERNTF